MNLEFQVYFSVHILSCYCSIAQNVAGNIFRSTSVSIMYELLVGDKLYVVGAVGAIAAITGQETRNVFRAHIL